MNKKINITSTRGQTALVLVLLSAATLIFLAITINWGHIAQVKALITVAADQSASLLASDTASYGEMQKQQYLNDTNKVTHSTGVFLAIIMIVITIIITIITWGAGTTPAMILFIEVIDVLAITMSLVNLVLQVAVVQPGITSLWNSLQKNQPIQQQFYEQGISTALQSATTDQGKVTDYFDSNANGVFGLTGVIPNDSVGRFALFYTERLKMLNQLLPPIPQVVLFYNQLGELMNGGSCNQNAMDVSLGLGISTNPICAPLGCNGASGSPSCSEKIPGSFQLNDTCTTSSPADTSTYNPYCDPCCQVSAPSSCAAVGLSNCLTNNAYNVYGSYPYLYDQSFQNYAKGTSFLDQLGRDQQMGPFTSPASPFGLTPDVMSPAGVTPLLEFPNGVFPFFWLMRDFSPEVDNINLAGGLSPSQYHWCVAGTAMGGGGTVPAVSPPSGFPSLTQLGQAPFALPYVCSGADCCVNQISTTAATFSSVTSSSISITLTGGPTVSITSPPTGSYFSKGSNVTITAVATDPASPITSVTINDPSGVIYTCAASPCNDVYANVPVLTDTLTATATDNAGVSANSVASVIINVIQPIVQLTTIVNAAGGALVTGATAKVTATVTGLGAAPATFISSVQFFNDKGAGPVLIGTGVLTGGAYVLTWANVPTGNYKITAAAVDQNGFSTASSNNLSGTIP